MHALCLGNGAHPLHATLAQGINAGVQLRLLCDRMHAGTLREVSGVCTHPDAQGRGLARRLMHLLLRRELQRGETPFLHVMRDNHLAHDLYERMGFRDRQEGVVRVLLRRP